MHKLDLSQITDSLYVGKTPRRRDYELLKDIGITLAINMRVEWPSKYLSHQKLIKEVWFPTFDSRFLLINQEKLLKVARQAVKEIDSGCKVYVYCRQGRHRSVVMTGAILLLLDYNLASVLNLLPDKRPVADVNAIQVKKVLSKFAHLNNT